MTLADERGVDRFGHAVQQLQLERVGRELAPPGIGDGVGEATKVVTGYGGPDLTGVVDQVPRAPLEVRVGLGLPREHRRRPSGGGRDDLLVVPVGALHQADAQRHPQRGRRPRHQVAEIGERVLPVGLDDASQLHVGPLATHAPQQLVPEVLRFVVLGVEVHRRAPTARAVEHRAQPRQRRVHRFRPRQGSEQWRQRRRLHGHVDAWERAPRVALQEIARRPRPSPDGQDVDELDDSIRIPLRLRLADHPLPEQVDGDRLALVPQPAQTDQRAVRILAGDELARHAPDVAARHRRRDHAAERYLFGDVEPQLHRPRHGHAVEVLGHVTEHVGGVTALGEHIDEPEQLRLEFGVGEGPLEHLLAPPTQMERADPPAVARRGEAARDGLDVPLECVVHLRSAVTEVRIPEHPDLEVRVLEAALDDVADADDAAELPLLDHREVADAPDGHLHHDVTDAVVG